MRHIVRAGVFAVSLCIFSAVPAAAAPKLFGDFALGQSKGELAKRPGAAPGQGGFSNDLLLPEASFAGLQWTVRLEFSGENLMRVSLTERYSRERMEAVTRQLRSEGFEMLAVLVDDASLDLVRALKSQGPDSVKPQLARLLQGKAPKRMTYAWFGTTALSKEMKTMAGSVKELLMSAPAETREAEVTLLRDPATGKPGTLLVDFSFPLLR